MNKIQKMMSLGLFFFIHQTSAMHITSIKLKNETSVPMAVVRVYNRQDHMSDHIVPLNPLVIQPGHTETIPLFQGPINHHKLTFIGATPWMENIKNENIVRRFIDVNGELDKAQHRATWDETASVTYAIKAGWTSYYIELIPE